MSNLITIYNLFIRFISGLLALATNINFNLLFSCVLLTIVSYSDISALVSEIVSLFSSKSFYIYTNIFLQTSLFNINLSLSNEDLKSRIYEYKQLGFSDDNIIKIFADLGFDPLYVSELLDVGEKSNVLF